MSLDHDPSTDNPYESLPCGDCDVPYRDHVNEEGAAPCDNFHFCQDTAADLRADCSDLWETNARLRAEVEALRSEIAPWQTLAEKLGRQNDNMLSEVARLSRDYVATWEANAALTTEVERLRSEVTQLRIFRCHVCDSPMRLVEDGDGDGDGYLYACTRAGCHEECLCSTRQVTA